MNMTEIKYFLDIAMTGNMSRSAERLHTSQPAISRSVRQLEEELGAKLFKRGKRGMELSDDGRALFERLAPVASELAAIEEMFKPSVNPEPKVAIEVAAASEIASDALALWVQLDPECRVSLVQGASAGGASGDIAIASAPAQGSVQRSWFSEDIMLAAPACTFDSSKPLEFSQLAKLEFISLPRSYGFSGAVAAMCEREGFKPRSVFESNNPNVVRKMIDLGLGVGFWPSRSWGDPREFGLELYSLAGSPKRDVCISLTAFGALNERAPRCYRYLCNHFARAFE